MASIPSTNTSGGGGGGGFLAALTADRSTPPPPSQQQQQHQQVAAELLEQALWGELDDDVDDDDSDGTAPSADSDDTLLALPELVGDELLHAQAQMPAAPEFQPLQAAALPNRRNLARRSRSKMFRCQPNRARDGRREELVYLNQKVAELEAQLAGLKKRRVSDGGDEREKSEFGALVATTPSSSAASRAVARSVWQEIAGRQSEQRVKAERENIRLKLVLEHQIKTAKSLEGILHKKLVTKEIEKCVDGNRQHRVCPPTSDAATDDALFAELLAGVEQSYAEVDTVFAASAAARDGTATSTSDAQVRSDGAGGMFLEFFATKVIPFDVRTTGAAVWQHFVFAKERTPYRFYYNKSHKSLDATEDTVVENFNLELHANSTQCRFRVKQVLRRYVEEERVVVVWRAFVDPIEFSEEPVAGVRFHEKGYILITRSHAVADGSYALLQQCGISTPMFTHDAASGGEHPKVGAITDFVLSSTAANISASRQMIENVLLEHAMRGTAFGDSSLPLLRDV